LKGSATLTGIEVAGSVNALELLADGQLFIDRARIGDEIRMDHASIRSNLFLQGTRLSGLSLSHSRIGGQLYLGSGDHALAWGKHARIDLRNAAARDFRFDPTRWTEARSIDLRGFKYDALTLDETADLGSRRAALIDWLRSTGSPSPQPFQQLAATLQIAGHVEAASDVLYAAREQQRRLSTGIRRIGLSLLCWTTGYGIGARYFRALWWVTALVAAGAITLTIWPAPWPNSSQPLGLVDRVSYSLDVLLPILDLDRRFDAVQLQDPARYYFYLHRALGWALASFVVAGLAGLTKR
jgi:hypothetical protein